ncbi:heavy-metal-associated domain-containing protein, partial [Pseudanabaenaceae cyanobacterium LEGE 13415]|nr:heavy-metal-associated domain-containing protein [Pseudanabaenaceae cyanobacterium LEGE 13415]
FMVEQQKLLGLPGVEIEQQNEHLELVLNDFLPVNLLDVMGEQLLEVSQATVTLWHKFTTAIRQIGSALLDWVTQTFYRILWGIDRVLEALLDSGHSGTEQSASDTLTSSNQAIALAQGIRIAHKTTGRIRVKIPRSLSQSIYLDRMRLQLQQLEGIRSITVNPVAASIVIYFDPKIPVAQMEQQIFTCNF